MIYVIMAAGEGTRWSNYLGVPKHLIEINGENLLERTTRLLKENGIENYIITGRDDRYAKYGRLLKPTNNTCEIDRFEKMSEPVCYLYGDVYYTEQAIKTIINTDAKDIMFFGSQVEIFAVKVNDLGLFYRHVDKVKRLYLNGDIGRCIGWEVYRSLSGIPFYQHLIRDRYIVIEDDTDDIDYPEDYERFKERRERK